MSEEKPSHTGVVKCRESQPASCLCEEYDSGGNSAPCNQAKKRIGKESDQT